MVKREIRRYATGFAAAYSEGTQLQQELLRVRAVLAEQIQCIDDFISGASRGTPNIPYAGDCLKWSREWYEIANKEADEAGE